MTLSTKTEQATSGSRELKIWALAWVALAFVAIVLDKDAIAHTAMILSGVFSAGNLVVKALKAQGL